MSAWTETEEAAFAQIMEAGQLERLPAIRLYRRFDGNLEGALRIATDFYWSRAAKAARAAETRQSNQIAA